MTSNGEREIEAVGISTVKTCMCNSNLLYGIPIELIAEIQLFALSPSFPQVSKFFYRIFKSAPASYHAEYILGRIFAGQNRSVGITEILTKALRYPLCSKDVFDAIYKKCQWQIASVGCAAVPELPRRLFRSLVKRRKTLLGGGGGRPAAEWSESDHPLPFLKYLYHRMPFPNPNSHDGYGLTKAVNAQFRPLVRFLLDHGASPRHKNALAVTVAIHLKDLALVRMLIEREDADKKGKLADRVEVNADMLDVAVRCDARDIVEYFLKEKGCPPDLQTLRSSSLHAHQPRRRASSFGKKC